VSTAGSVAEAIADIYRQVNAPSWAAANRDALADVLRDLSWLPPGPVTIRVRPVDQTLLGAVLDAAQQETADTARPVRVVRNG
jgi:hypothetical protein